MTNLSQTPFKFLGNRTAFLQPNSNLFGAEDQSKIRVT